MPPRRYFTTIFSAIAILVPKGPLGTQLPFPGVRKGPGRKVPHGVLFECIWLGVPQTVLFWVLFFGDLWVPKAPKKLKKHFFGALRARRPSQVRKKGSFGRGVFSENSIFWESRESRNSRDSRELPDYGKQRGVRPFSRDSREFRDFRDSKDSPSEKTHLVMTPFSGPDPKHSMGHFPARVSGQWALL